MPGFSQDLEILRRHTAPCAYPSHAPFAVMMSAVPGAGKTFIARQICQEFGMVHLESDFLRLKLIGPQANHGESEDKRLFSAINERGKELLEQGYSVVFDSTNLREKDRKKIYDIVGQVGAPLFIFKLTLPESEIKKRLKERASDLQNYSQADFEIYLKMKRTEEPIEWRHVKLDSNHEDVYEKVVHTIREGLLNGY